MNGTQDTTAYSGEAASDDPGHAHRWRIDGQAGPESEGHCACGAVRQFANSYTSEQTSGYRRGQRRDS